MNANDQFRPQPASNTPCEHTPLSGGWCSTCPAGKAPRIKAEPTPKVVHTPSGGVISLTAEELLGSFVRGLLSN